MAFTRDPLKQAGLSTSIWNAPLASDWVGVAANLVPASNHDINYTPICIMMEPTQPLTNIDKQANPGTSQTICTHLTPVQTFDTVPINPACIIPAPSPKNSGFAAVKPDGHSFDQGAQYAFCSGFAYATAGKCRSGQDDLYDSLITGSAGASKASILGGVLRLGELVPGGSINHALSGMVSGWQNLYHASQLAPTASPPTSAANAGAYRWPATAADSYWSNPTDGSLGHYYGGTNLHLSMGALLALPKNFNLSQMQSGPGLILAKCLMKYGMYIINDSVTSVNIIATEISHTGPGTVTGDVTAEFQNKWGFAFAQGNNAPTAWAADCRLIWASFLVVDSNTLAFYNAQHANYIGSGTDAAPAGNPASYSGMGGAGAPLTSYPPDLIPVGGSVGIAPVGTPTIVNPTLAQSTATAVRSVIKDDGLVLLVASRDSVTGRHVTGVSDGVNTWQQWPSAYTQNGQEMFDAWYCTDVAATGSISVQVTMNDATGATTLLLYEFSGQDVNTFIDQLKITTGNSAAPNSGATPATTSPNEYVMGVVVVGTASVAPTLPVFSNALTAEDAGTLAQSSVGGLRTALWCVTGALATEVTEAFSATIGANPWICATLTLLPAGASSSGLPTAPQNVRAIAGNGQATVSWDLPSSTGGSPLIGGTIQPRKSTDGGVTWSNLTSVPIGTPISETGSEVGASGTGAGAASLVLATGITLVAGQDIVLAVTAAAATAPLSIPISDTKGNTWERIAGITNPAGTLRLEVWRSTISTGGSANITAQGSSTDLPTFTTVNSGLQGSVFQMADLDPTTTIDITAITAAITGSSYVLGPTASALAGDLVFGVIAYKSATGTITSGPTFSPSTSPTTGAFRQLSGTDNNSMETAWEIASTNGTQQLTFGLSASFNGCGILVCFRQVNSSGSTSQVVTGLTNGNLLDFEVALANINGQGPFSLPGGETVPTAGTSVPTWATNDIPTVVAGTSDMLVSWPMPNQGTAQITEYDLIPFDVTTSTTLSTIVINDTGGPGGTPSLSFDATGIYTAGHSYTHTVKAKNSVGTSAASPASAAASLTAFVANPPDQMDPPTAVINNLGQPVINFGVPFNGGAAITDYVLQYRTTVGPGAWTTFAHTADPAGNPITFTAGTPLTAYDFQIAATNSAGTGTYSNPLLDVIVQNPTIVITDQVEFPFGPKLSQVITPPI